MPDVYLYKRVHGYKFEKYFAQLPGVQMALQTQALHMSWTARGVLARHREQGHSRINVTKGRRTDWYVNLDDERGQRAAWAIEKGTKRSKGIGALARAKLQAKVFI